MRCAENQFLRAGAALLTGGWEARLERVLDQYQTDYFLLETTGARGELWRSVKPHIGKPLYCDDQTVLLSAEQVRRGVAIWARRRR